MGPDQTQVVTITATDNLGLTATTTFDLVVDNVAPDISAAKTSVTVREGLAVRMTGTFSDAGLDSVTLESSIGTVTDNGDGTWSWSFDTNDGPDDSQTVTITATDSDDASAQTTFELVVNNAGPNLDFDALAITVYEGETATKTGVVTDVDGVASLTASQGTVQLNSDGSWTLDRYSLLNAGYPAATGHIDRHGRGRRCHQSHLYYECPQRSGHFHIRCHRRDC